MSNNSISSLPPSTYNSLTKLFRHPCRLSNCSRLQVDLRHNKLTCDCGTAGFIDWLSQTDIQLINKDRYTCKYHGHVRNITDIRIYEGGCTVWISIAIVTGTLTALITGMCILGISKKKLAKRHQRRQVKLAIEKYKHNQNEYLVFLAYSHCDSDLLLSEIYPRLQRNLQQRLESDEDMIYINDRHFRPGSLIADEIVRAISVSHVIVLFVSDAFLCSNYCELESYIAFEERKPIVLIFSGKIESLHKKMPPIFRRIYSKWARNIWPAEGTDGEKDYLADKVCQSVLETYAESIQDAANLDQDVPVAMEAGDNLIPMEVVDGGEEV